MASGIYEEIQFLDVSLTMMRYYLSLLIFVPKLVLLLTTNSSTYHRSDKLLSIFSVVQFKNTECESNNTLGLCVTVKEVTHNFFRNENFALDWCGIAVNILRSGFGEKQTQG